MHTRNWIGRLTRLAGVGLLAWSAAQPALAQEKKTLKVSIIPISDVAPLFAAIKEGYFKAEGLEIDTAPTAGGAVGVPGLVAGAYDIVFTNVVSTVLAKGQGLPVKIVSPGSQQSSAPPEGGGLVARKGEALKTGADFAGKTIGVNTQNNIIWLYARAWVKKTGGDPAKVTYREVPFPQMADALRGKQVDAIFTVDPFLATAKTDPAFELVAWPYGTVQPNLAVAQYIATEDFIKKNPETIKRFNAALNKGIAWTNQRIGKPELFELISSYTRIPVDRLAATAVLGWPTSVDKDSIQKTIALMKENGLLKADVRADDLVERP